MDGFYLNKMQSHARKVLPAEDCYDAYPGGITDSMFCSGDGTRYGSPLVCKDELQGIASWHYSEEPHAPMVYAKICLFNDWIERSMAINGESSSNEKQTAGTNSWISIPSKRNTSTVGSTFDSDLPSEAERLPNLMELYPSMFKSEYHINFKLHKSDK